MYTFSIGVTVHRLYEIGGGVSCHPNFMQNKTALPTNAFKRKMSVYLVLNPV
jgi:hypothetical protein